MLRDMLKGFLSLVPRATPEWDLTERRTLIRMRCHYKCPLISEEKKAEGTVIDMGLGGLQLKTFHPLRKGQRVTVESPFHEVGLCSQPVEVEVRWIHNPERNLLTYAGCSYVSSGKEMAESWVKGILKQLGFRPEFIRSKRRSVRAESFLDGALRRPDGTRQEVRIHNLGAGGALFECRNVLAMGEEQSLRVGPLDKLSALDVTGTLVKARPEGKNFLYGMEFGELKPAQARLLTLYLKELLKASWD